MSANGKVSLADKKPTVEDFEPLWDYCLLEAIKDNITKGGIELPEGKSADSTARYLVVKAGPGAYRDSGTFVPNPIKVGDILFSLSFRQPLVVILNGKQYLCLSGRDAIAVMKGPNHAEDKD